MAAFLSIAAYYLLLSGAAPILRREVPQEHSHEFILTSVQTSLQSNNPDGIVDSVFGLLGDAAAAGGAGKITNLDCLQQATADQAFTNAKAAGDVESMTNALLYRALERNTGAVGLASVLCNQTATNPEIAAISQHQDPASTNAAATNKAIVLELAKQIASIGGNPQDALNSGTFAPGNPDDTTGSGNSCDDANDARGCIFTQNLLVDDATADEINAAVAGISASGSSSAASASGTDTAATSTAIAAATTAAAATAANAAAACATATVTVTSVATSAATPSASGNLQTFTGALGGIAAPAVTASGSSFVVTDNDSFVDLPTALGRSCDVQHNLCADSANSGGGFSVGSCDTQNTACNAAIST
ncbi:uncharacterized protein PHACADRAFT_262280 [Phanerochaete carnosa HHB-10118-sp]|uniref:Uncharacterized protein n=1 Tax=Phanerochaete carnosa (strain HHB-10118-sp) TaxID=650164 RepID=K5VZ61_PHACS|nr:uncharacterized protein PHACADRAFT_262280 [Phanerochaete carnosa HHB-10118-sp]EKM51884.1 hypothetical protein PHACADRAFT_262280 [Phanerochaete carnosa HHB-10118-sp]